MIEKSVSELGFLQYRGSMPTVEIDIDSIPDKFLGYGDLISQALEEIASCSVNMIASVYVYQGQSTNFGVPTFSAFIGIAGKEKLLETLLISFRKIAGVKARFSDHIDFSTAICEVHIQDGHVWQPIDAFTWCAESAESTIEERIESAGADTRLSYPSRFRAARGDASIGSMKRIIETTFKLPSGSVVLCDPKGKSLRADATISTLRKRWESL